MQPTASQVDVEQGLFRFITRAARRRYPRETGGILMGRWLSGGRALVTAVIGPGPKAQHGRTSFEPDQNWQEREVARLYKRSGRIWNYLGDWHTHPDGSATPSDQDVAVARGIARASRARCPAPVMLIAGVRRGRAIDCVVYQYRASKLERCDLLINGEESRFGDFDG